MKKTIKLTESQLERIISKTINESEIKAGFGILDTKKANPKQEKGVYGDKSKKFDAKPVSEKFVAGFEVMNNKTQDAGKFGDKEEKFDAKPISEEQLNEILGFSAKEQFAKHFDEFIKTWVAKGVPAPTSEEKSAILAKAAEDKFEGKLGLNGDVKNLKAGKFTYRPSASIKFKNQFAGGGTGDAAGGTTGA